MATSMSIRRVIFVTRFLRNSAIQRNTLIYNPCKNVHNSTNLSAEQGLGIEQHEQSWIRKMLYGSGPSADVEEEAEEKQDAVTVEPRYMEILQHQTTFIDRPEVRKRVYRPPADLTDVLRNITVEACQVSADANWQEVSLDDNHVKYKILSKCSGTLKHDVPNFLLNRMQTMSDVLNFYQVEVKDTSVFDELSAQDLPENLKIYWDYKDDSRLEVYEDWLEYVKKKGPKKEDIPKIRHW